MLANTTYMVLIELGAVVVVDVAIVGVPDPGVARIVSVLGT